MDEIVLAPVGVDIYNQTLTGEVSKTMNSIKSDADHVPCVMIPLTEKRFFDWQPDEVSVTLRNAGGSYGGGAKRLSSHSTPNRYAAPSATTTTKDSTDRRWSKVSG